MGQDESQIEVEEEDTRTESEKAADNQIDQLDAFFGSLQPGVSVLIERVQPSWCSGVLEEIQVTNEGLSLDYLINTWGGHLLLLKPRGRRGRLAGGSYRVPLYSYPPLRFGEKLQEFDKAGRFRNNEEKEMTQLPPQPPVVVNPENSLEKIFSALPVLLPIVTQWMERAEARRQNDQAMLFQIMKSQQSSPFTDVTKLGNMMKEMSSMFGAQMGGGGGDEMGFITQAMDVLKMVMDNKKTPQPQQQMPPQVRSPQPSKLTAVQSPPVVHNPVTQSPLDLQEQIANLEPSEAAMTLMGALGRMPQAKREAAEQALAQLYGDYQSMGEDEEYDDFGEEGEIAENDQ